MRDLMLAAVEHRFSLLNRLPKAIEWLTDNRACYIARETRGFAKEIGLLPLTTPVESTQSNGMAGAFVRTFKHDYVRVNPCSDAKTVIASLPKWFRHYNTLHPHKASGIVHPESSSPNVPPIDPSPIFRGQQHHYNHRRYHENVGNLTPADVYFRHDQKIPLNRERIKRTTIQNRRLQHQMNAE